MRRLDPSLRCLSIQPAGERASKASGSCSDGKPSIGSFCKDMAKVCSVL